MVGEKSEGGYYVDVIQKRERMLHLLKRLPRKIAVSRMATSLALALPSTTAVAFYTAVIIIVPVPLQQASELRPRLYSICFEKLQFVGNWRKTMRQESQPPTQSFRAIVPPFRSGHFFEYDFQMKRRKKILRRNTF